MTALVWDAATGDGASDAFRRIAGGDGVPYRWRDGEPRQFDCSELVQTVLDAINRGKGGESAT